MRTLTARPAAALATSGVTVARVLCVHWNGTPVLTGGDHYYTDAAPAWTLATGYSTFETIIQAWPAPAPATDTGVVFRGQFSGVTFSMISDETATVPLRARIASDNPMGARVTLYEVVKPLTGTNVIGDWIVLGVWRVVAVQSSQGLYTFTCEDWYAHLGSESFVTETIEASDYPNAPTASLGKTVPQAFGTVKGVPLIPVNGSPSITLYASLDTTGGIISTGGDISDDTAWPASGLVRIDSELIAYSCKTVGTPSALGSATAPVVRGQFNSVAAAHSLGTAVRRVLTGSHAYQFLVTGHDSAIRVVYADGSPIPATNWNKSVVGKGGTPATRADCLVGVDWNPPSKNTGMASEARVLTDPTSDTLVPQVLWETPDPMALSGDVTNPAMAFDGSEATFATMIGGNADVQLGSRVKTRLTQLSGICSLRRLEFRLRYQAYTPKGNAWPSYAPELWVGTCSDDHLSEAGLVPFAKIPVERPLDMNAITNLFPEGVPNKDSKYLFDTKGTDTNVDPQTFGDSAFGYLSGYGTDTVHWRSYTSMGGYVDQQFNVNYWLAYASIAVGHVPASPSGFPMQFGSGGTLPTYSGTGMNVGSNPPLASLEPVLRFSINPGTKPSPAPTITNIQFTATATADSRAFYDALPKMEVSVENVGAGSCTPGSVTIPAGGSLPTTAVVNGSFTFEQLAAMVFRVSAPINGVNWDAADEMTKWTLSGLSVTCNFVTSTTGVTLTGKTVSLLANALIPSPVIEQRVDLTAFADDWGIFPGNAAGTNRLGALLKMRSGTHDTLLYVYEFGLYAEWTRATSADVDLSERIFTADIGGLGAGGVTGIALTLKDLWAVVLPNSRIGVAYDSVGLAAALALVDAARTYGSGDWPCSRYLSAPMTLADLLAEMAVSSGIRWAIDSGRMVFFPSLVPRGSETVRLAVDPNLMVSAGAMPDYHVDLMANRIVGRYSFIPDSDAAATVTVNDTHSQGGAWGVREKVVNFPWIDTAAQAAILAAWMLADAALVKGGFNVTLVEFRTLVLEVGDVVTVVDAYASYPTTRGRVIGIGRAADGVGAVYAIVTGAAITGGLVTGSKVGESTTKIVVDQTDNSMTFMSFFSLGVAVAKLDSSGVLQLHGVVVEEVPWTTGDFMGAGFFEFTAEAGLWLAAWRDSDADTGYNRVALIDGEGNLHVQHVSEWGADVYPIEAETPSPFVVNESDPLARYAARDPSLVTAYDGVTLTGSRFSTDGNRTMLHAFFQENGTAREVEIRCRRVIENAF